MPAAKRNHLASATIANALVLALSLWLSGCLFDSKLPPVETISVQGQFTDTLYPSGATPARIVNLFQPVLDSSLGTGKSSTLETLAPVNVKEASTKEVVQYRLSRQRFGTWSPLLEFQWNYFLLMANFLFPAGIPDTTGLANQTKSLFDSVHHTDLFTNYFDSASAPSILNRINTSTKAGAVGIAVKRPSGSDTLLIQEVVAGSPADKGGLAVGMGILAVNDSTVVGDSALERFQRFSVGDSGVVVVLKVKGPQGIADVSMTRMPVAFPTVLADSLSPKVGYISISGFTPSTVGGKSTYTEFHDALIKTQRFPITILDLRDNGGGSVDIAFKMCDEILTSGTIIIREHQRRFEDAMHVPMGSEIVTRAASGGVGENAPDGGARKYLLLANGHSASAAEIMLVSLKEGIQAPLMGTLTYGKGVGQTVRGTPGHGVSLVTFLKFTSASGLDYHKKGLVPDYPDSASADTQLVDATKRAELLLGGPAAKLSADASTRADRDLVRRAAAIEWNRRLTLRPGIREIEISGARTPALLGH